MMERYFSLINEAFENRDLLEYDNYRNAVLQIIDHLDKGKLRVAEPSEDGWQVIEEAKKAILLYFGIAQMKTYELSPFEFHDKIPLKKNLKDQGVRVVPPGTVRYGSYMAPNTVLMPGYVNIGAYVDTGSMVDTHATVGSCAQIGKNVHLAGAVRIGGVLEPPQGKPVIVEDNAFLGSAVSVMEGVHVGKGAILGAGVKLTSSTRIIDVTGSEEKIIKGHVPDFAVVIPGSYEKEFPAGKYQVNCALIIGRREEKHDQKLSLNEALREYGVEM